MRTDNNRSHACFDCSVSSYYENIPETWQLTTLGEVAQVVMGQSPKGYTVSEYAKKDAAEFHQGKSYFGVEVLEPSPKFTTQLKKIVSSPSILMSVRAPVGDVNKLTGRSIVIGRGLAAINPYVLNFDFIFLFLKTQKPLLESKATGSTFKAINQQTLINSIVPVLPTKEQELIVSQVQKFFDLIAQLD
jgi:type I restriction enzyme S subunit